ncbi:MAG: NYN domain-containing protein [Actinomycetota bacterium]|nr:NYN domain-containing protein [Actinomycetota bacterium]
MPRLVVDAMNVIGSRPTGWWRDRHAAIHELLGRLQLLTAETGDEVILVIDAAPPDLPEGSHGGVGVVPARRRGRDAADDRIVELVAGDPSPSTLVVVTSDRELRRRVTGLGARVWGAGELLRRLDELSGP